MGGAASFVDEFETVTVGVEDIGRVIVGVVMQARARCTVVGGTISQRRRVGRVDFGLVVRHKADMHRTPLHHAFAQPEKHTSIGTEPLQIQMPRRPVLAVVIKPCGDAQRGQCRCVEINGTINVTDRQKM